MDGWNAHFGRELNASDDRGHFEPFEDSHTARPVIEGKQIEPFRVHVDRSRYQLKAGAPDRVPRRVRLAYRDVASATNRLTLIAALVPARVVTTHTLFCLKTPLPLDAQHVLCGLLNSYVANYLVRFRVNTHVTVSLISRLPVPLIEPDDPAFNRIAALVKILMKGSTKRGGDGGVRGTPGARRRSYTDLTPVDFEHVLSTFPLVPERDPVGGTLRVQGRSLITGHGGTKTRRG